MNKIKVLVIDDEPGAHKVLENYINRTAQLELAGNSYNAVEAFNFLKLHKVDLLFLDITMPEINGFELLRMLENPPFVIFTTAHSEFAVESYEYNAIDYLKKPIPFQRFTKAVNKVIQWLSNGMTLIPPKEFIHLKIDGELKAISLSQVSYIQSLGNYVKIFTGKKFWVTQITTSELEESLPKGSFLRIHKSFIVNKSKIDKISDEELMIGETKLPIGKTFKKYVKELAVTGSH